MDLVRKQTYITQDQDRALKQLANEYQLSEAELVRRALEYWLATQETKNDPFQDLIGCFDGPARGEHDDIYQ